MTELAIPVDEIQNEDQKYCGGKASSLGIMTQNGLNVPYAVCITTEAYNRYVNQTGLRGRILIELSRKRFEDMRWEEMWDASQKIRNMLANTPLPEAMYLELKKKLGSKFDAEPVVVRSSSVSEDSPYASFAGVHESYVNVKGIDSILEHIRLVWASLWSDSAMLYRKEMELDTRKSAMAVVVQDIVMGERSGVVFTMSPYNEKETVIEAVYGLNEGLVDGTVEPDRWILERETGTLRSHNSVSRQKAVSPSEDGTTLAFLPQEMVNIPPLKDEEVYTIFEISKKIEFLFKIPQDIEWTMKDAAVYILQSRPITTLREQDKDKKRLWYLSLRRNFENLRELRKKIEDQYIPEMISDARELESQDISLLSDDMLAGEIERRTRIYREWNDIYWQEFIPLAHGVRLFGKVYNDTVNPKDPFEFVDLLSGTEMISTERNNQLEEIARGLREDPVLIEELRKKRGTFETKPEFENKIEEFIVRFGGKYSEHPEMKKGLINLVLEMAAHEPAKQKKYTGRISRLKSQFLSSFKDEKKAWAKELLDLGKVSYKLRDDDNIYLGRIEAQVNRVIYAAKERLKNRAVHPDRIPTQELIKTLKNPGHQPEEEGGFEKRETINVPGIKARQLLGNPAGKGVAKGKARVIRTHADLFNVRSGEILVCDAVDPNMTFVVPLCSGIVERRGGMLIHGAIIAREYGLPCITGVPDVMDYIKTGDYISVDGFLGIVTILGKDE